MAYYNISRAYEDNVLLKKTLAFSIAVVAYAEELDGLHKWVVARQILKSGTSIGTNSTEAQSAESPRDFIHKLKIAVKEAHETYYWLLICKASSTYPNCDALMKNLVEIINLLQSIIKTTKKGIE